MKEFFQWYMVASIVGAWVLIAYAFYKLKLSQMSESICIELKNEDEKLYTRIRNETGDRLKSELALRTNDVKLQLANDELGEDLKTLEGGFSKALEDISVMREQMLALSKAYLVTLKENGDGLKALEDGLNKALATKEACIDERILKLKSEVSSLRRATYSFVKSVKNEETSSEV